MASPSAFQPDQLVLSDPQITLTTYTGEVRAFRDGLPSANTVVAVRDSAGRTHVFQIASDGDVYHTVDGVTSCIRFKAYAGAEATSLADVSVSRDLNVVVTSEMSLLYLYSLRESDQFAPQPTPWSAFVTTNQGYLSEDKKQVAYLDIQSVRCHQPTGQTNFYAYVARAVPCSADPRANTGQSRLFYLLTDGGVWAWYDTGVDVGDDDSDYALGYLQDSAGAVVPGFMVQDAAGVGWVALRALSDPAVKKLSGNDFSARYKDYGFVRMASNNDVATFGAPAFDSNAATCNAGWYAAQGEAVYQLNPTLTDAGWSSSPVAVGPALSEPI